MIFARKLFLLVCTLSYHVATNGQVYINPNAPQPVKEIKPTQQAGDSGLVTQTVYGFLDFTTTIGNTIMVFSPQSAPPPEPPKPASPNVVVNVIETKPHTAEPKVSEIRPSKTSPKEVKHKLSSVVQVVAGPAPISNSPKAQIIASKVEVVTSDQKSVVNVLPEKKKIYSKIEIQEASTIVVSAISSKVDVVNAEVSKVVNKPVFSSIVEVRSEEPEAVLQIGNNIAEPEYDFLSRQPSEFAEEKFKVINLRPTNAKPLHRTRANHEGRKSHSSSSKDTHPTGLVTKLSGTVVRNGATTVHETSVIGTYISGKYAQVLQSSSHVVKNNQKPRISPSSPTLRILKTAAPTVPVGRHHNIDPTPTGNGDLGPLPGDNHGGNSGPNHVRASRRPATSSNNFKNRIRNQSPKDSKPDNDVREQSSTPSNTAPHTTKKRNRNKSKNRRNSRKSSTANVEIATVSVYSELSTPSYSSRRNKASRNGNGFKSTATVSPPQPSSDSFNRRAFKPKIQPSSVVVEAEQPSSLYKFKLNRSPGRWQYKTTPKPRVTIRKNNDDPAPVTPPTSNANHEVITNDIPTANARSDDLDLESSGSSNGDVLNDAETGDNGIDKNYPVETIKVEISTPADYKDIYYEIATIKSPYTFQVGTLKNTRYITVTSTFEKSFDPEPSIFPATLTEPLTENILAPTSHIDKEHNLLDSSIATLPPLYLSSDTETPPLETLTETFSTTQQMLKTHILPIIRDGANASSLTLIQTYHVTRLVTATKTLPPMDAYQFVPSKRLKEFNSKLDEAGSELHLELDFGDNENDEDEEPSRQLPADLDLANIGSDFDVFDVDRSKINDGHLNAKKKVQKVVTEISPQSQNLSPEQLQQLALLRLLNPAAAAQVQQVVTTSKPVIRFDTVYETHVIPIVNGQSTSYSTISRPVGSVSRTEFEFGTSTLPGLPLPQIPQIPQIQQVPVNPLFPQQQQQFQLTTAPIITQTVVTQTQSKILKLTFGAKTAYTTLFSTHVFPTLLTTFVTTSVPIQPTAQAFPGYFPGAYAPYPFVG